MVVWKKNYLTNVKKLGRRANRDGIGATLRNPQTCVQAKMSVSERKNTVDNVTESPSRDPERVNSPSDIHTGHIIDSTRPNIKDSEQVMAAQDLKDNATGCSDKDALRTEVENLAEDDQTKGKVENDLSLNKKRCTLEEEGGHLTKPHSPEIPKIRKTAFVSPSEQVQVEVAADCPAYHLKNAG